MRRRRSIYDRLQRASALLTAWEQKLLWQEWSWGETESRPYCPYVQWNIRHVAGPHNEKRPIPLIDFVFEETMPNSSAFRKIYRFLSLVGIASVAFTLGLVLRKSPPPDVPYDPGAATRAELKFSAADQAKAEGRPAQVQLNSTELNSYLTQNMPHSSEAQPSNSTDSQGPANIVPSTSAPRPSADPSVASTSPVEATDQPTLQDIQSDVKDVKVDMDGDLVKAYVVYNLHGKDVSLELDGHVGAKDGYLDFEPVAGKLGSMPLPASVLASAVDKMMASPENREKLRLPDDITDVQIVNGQAVLSYK